MYPRTIEICISESYSRLVALMLSAALHNRKLFRSSVPLTVYYSESCQLCRELIPELPGSLHRELHPVFCAESYSRSVVPKATLRFGLVCRELLPVCCAESYSRSVVPRSKYLLFFCAKPNKLVGGTPPLSATTTPRTATAIAP
jgi:hypothetical protein